MKALRRALTALGSLLLLCGAAVAVASTRVDRAPSVCFVCGGDHFPQPPLMSYIRTDLGLGLAAVGLAVLTSQVLKSLFAVPGHHRRREPD